MKQALLDAVDGILATASALQLRAGDAAAADFAKILRAGGRFRELVLELPAAAEDQNPGAAFTRTVTHDLLNPLNQIVGYAEMIGEELEDQPPGPDGPSPAQVLEVAAAAKRLTTQVEIAAGRTPTLSVDATPPIEVASARRPMPAAAHPLLVVDDDPLNRDLLAQRLERQGFSVLTAADGLIALGILENQPIDLVLLDVMMPQLDGYQVLERMQANPVLQDVPVLMISGLSEIESVVRCIEMGAADYLTKPFNPVLLHARIGACLEKKQLRDQERRTFLALEASQKALAAELAEAAGYVRSLLPPPSRRAAITVDWRFVPSMQLGGDAFGHQWLDPDRLALYLFDVCGHGVGAALLSVAIIDAVRSGRVPGADMGDPGTVLRGLNDAFPMELHNGQYFTMWYGVYDRRTRTLVHASGGHPAALLIAPADAGVAITQVRQPGMIVGGMPDVDYGVGETTVPPGSRLYVFSDGLFEVSSAGRMVPYEVFLNLFASGNDSPLEHLDRVVSQMSSLAGGQFDDDVSIMEVVFD